MLHLYSRVSNYIHLNILSTLVEASKASTKTRSLEVRLETNSKEKETKKGVKKENERLKKIGKKSALVSLVIDCFGICQSLGR